MWPTNYWASVYWASVYWARVGLDPAGQIVFQRRPDQGQVRRRRANDATR